MVEPAHRIHVGMGGEARLPNAHTQTRRSRRRMEEYDRGDKFEHYQALASLRQYVLVSPGEFFSRTLTRI